MSRYTTYLEAKEAKIDILSDHFDSVDGQWKNLITFDDSQLQLIQNQRHNDIRSFYTGASFLESIIHLNNKSVNSYNGIQVQNLVDTVKTIENEKWIINGNPSSLATVGQQTDCSNWFGLSVSCSTTPKTISSVFDSQKTVSLTNYDSTDWITLSLPANGSTAALTNIDLANSSITFSTTANFANNTTDEIKFNAVGVIITTDSNGNKELKFPVSKLVNTKTAILGVKFTLVASTGTPIFRCLSIRCVSKNWIYAPIDFNTLWTIVAATPSPNGAALTNGIGNITAGVMDDYQNWVLNTNTSHFPGVDTNGQGPIIGWPAVFKSFTSYSSNDYPSPSDVSMQVLFNTGTLNNNSTTSSTDPNEIHLYFRAKDQVISQSDLNGFAQSYMDDAGDLNKFKKTVFKTQQKDLSKIPGGSRYPNAPSLDPDYQISGDPFIPSRGKQQGQLNPKTQQQIAEYTDPNRVSYFVIKIKWYWDSTASASQCKFVINDETNNTLYTKDLPAATLKSNTDYVFIPSIQEGSFKIELYEIHNAQIGNPNRLIPIFNSRSIKTVVINESKGRVGWSARFVDGDAYIQSMLSRGAIYTKMRSTINSFTPIKGIQAFVESNQYVELVSNLTKGPFNVTNSNFVSDYNISKSNNCWRIENAAGSWQGIQTNKFVIDNFNNISINFKILTTDASQRIVAMLYNDLDEIIIPIYVPDFVSGSWQDVRLIINGENYIVGSYSLILAELSSLAGSKWWIDSLKVGKNQLSWYARSYVNGVNEIGADNWMPFNKIINNTNDGILFSGSGNELQIKVNANTQYVELEKINFVPKYATLGNFTKND